MHLASFRVLAASASTFMICIGFIFKSSLEWFSFLKTVLSLA